MTSQPRSLYDKLWDTHLVAPLSGDTALIYIDRHLVQEVSSPQAFDGLKARGLAVRRPDAHIATPDHAIPTTPNAPINPNSMTARQVARLEENAAQYDIPYFPMGHDHHGIVHIIGPELGFTLPGATLVCGDSHTSTHGAFGALAFGIGTSECECVFATQTLPQARLKNMRITLTGSLPRGVSIKDVILAIIAKIGIDGGRGHAIEYAGPTVEALSMEERMTLCNMSIEAGARIGLVAPDETTFAYLAGRPMAPQGTQWRAAVNHWRTLRSDDGAHFDKEVSLDVSALAPQISWGTTPAESASIEATAPDPAAERDPAKRKQLAQSLEYMGLEAGAPLAGTHIDTVFIGSCTNGRIEDLRRAACVARRGRVAEHVNAMVVPGSQAVLKQAEAEGLDAIFREAGFDWRKPGCSMCVAMNEDRLKPGNRSASTSNRNFEGRQGPGGRTHLMSPEMAAAAALMGRLTDVRSLMETQ